MIVEVHYDFKILRIMLGIFLSCFLGSLAASRYLHIELYRIILDRCHARSKFFILYSRSVGILLK